MEKEEKLLIAAIEDKARRCLKYCRPLHTGFLSMEQCAGAEDISRRLRCQAVLYGGYEDAERRVMIFLPDNMDDGDIPAQFQPLSAIRVKLPKGAPKLSHRDYLGSLLSLGVERSVLGDILVRPDGADIVVMADIAEFFLHNFIKAGRVDLEVELIEIENIKPDYVELQELKDTVASLRLDNIVSSAFRLSRGASQEAVRQGLVSLNGRRELRPDASVSEGDKLVLRGRGRVVLKEAGGHSRKGRIMITLEKYI